MNVAITGATGFIGSNLISQLRAKNISVTSFDCNKHNLLKPNSLKDFISHKDVVVHLAGVNKDGELSNIIKTNVLGTKGLLDAMVAYAPSTKLIFASSFMVYLPSDFFGASKKVAEDLIIEYAKEKNIKSIIFRLSNIYGNSAKPLRNSAISTFVYKIKNNEEITINGDGSQRRDYIHVSDAINALIKALDYKPNPIEYFDICSGTLTSLNECLSILEKISAKKLQVCYNKQVKSDDLYIQKDFAKAREILGWSPDISLEKGFSSFFTS